MNGNLKLTIGKLAKAANVGVETIRFYERKGLIQQPKKQGAFRYYSKELIERIKFIKKSQALGFTLKESKEFLDLKMNHQSKCYDVLIKTETKIKEINKKMRDLQRMKESLQGLTKCCKSSEMSLSECPILDCIIEKDH